MNKLPENVKFRVKNNAQAEKILEFLKVGRKIIENILNEGIVGFIYYYNKRDARSWDFDWKHAEEYYNSHPNKEINIEKYLKPSKFRKVFKRITK